MVKYCVLIATYNNAKTLKKVVDGVLEICSDVLVVNDGSTDGTKEILNTIQGVKTIQYPKNKGKGYALRQGFKKAHELGFDFAITIDSDGQHETKNIKDLVDALEQHDGKKVLLMGSRNMTQESVPKKSSFGNKFSNFWFWVETGIKLSDTQTGFRAYPLGMISKMTWFTRKFEFEIEVIVRLAWKGVEIKEVPVSVDYPEDRISHFRPFTDFTRISILNTVLFTMAALFYAPKRVFFGKGEKSLLSRLKTELSLHRDNPSKMAASIGVGLFFGIFPIWGFQMLAAFGVAKAFKLNSIIVLGASNISIPPMIPIIVYLSYLFGLPFVENGALLPSLQNLTLESIQIQITQYLIGSVLLSLVAGLIGFGISYLSLENSSRN